LYAEYLKKIILSRDLFQLSRANELSGFVANELSAFSVLHEGSILRTGGERRMFAFLASYSCAGVIHSHSPAAFAEHGGKWLWIALSVRLPLLLV
jgi:hypothetical protein